MYITVITYIEFEEELRVVVGPQRLDAQLGDDLVADVLVLRGQVVERQAGLGAEGGRRLEQPHLRERAPRHRPAQRLRYADPRHYYT